MKKKRCFRKFKKRAMKITVCTTPDFGKITEAVFQAIRDMIEANKC